jgi:thiol-disulfide isomerase/thioredoxin
MRLALFIVIVLGGCAEPGRPALHAIAASTAAPLPPLSYRLSSGPTWTSQSALGRVIVLDVWATYCKPCRHAIPKLNRIAAARPDVTVLGVSVDNEDAVVDAFLREVPASFPIARWTEHAAQSGPLAIRSLPTVLVVDRRGRIRLRVDAMPEADYDALPAVIDALRAE